MELIALYYATFAIATGVCSCLFLLVPLVHQARTANIKNSFTENTKLSYLVYIILSTIIAPIMILTIFNTAASARFTLGLSKTVLKQD